MVTLNPYLNFNGNCEEAFNFYKSVFGGEFDSFSRFNDGPNNPPVSESEANKVLNVALPISPGNVLMGSDVPDSFGKATFGDNNHISITTDSEEEAAKLFNGLSDGGEVMMPLEKTFWGAYFGMFADKFGVRWMVSYNYNS